MQTGFWPVGPRCNEFAAGTLTWGSEFDPILRVKYVLPLLVVAVCGLAACKTTSDRRDLYSPTKPSGPATAELRDWTLFGGNNHKSTTYTYAISTPSVAPGGPIAPPPPAPAADNGMPDINSGAPAATPVPGAEVPVVPHAPKYTSGATPPAPAGGGAGGIPMATPTDAGGGGDSGGGSGAIPGLSQ